MWFAEQQDKQFKKTCRFFAINLQANTFKRNYGSSVTGLLVKSSLGTVCGSVVVRLQARTLKNKKNVWLARCRRCADNICFRKGVWSLFDLFACMFISCFCEFAVFLNFLENMLALMR